MGWVSELFISCSGYLIYMSWDTVFPSERSLVVRKTRVWRSQHSREKGSAWIYRASSSVFRVSDSGIPIFRATDTSPPQTITRTPRSSLDLTPGHAPAALEVSSVRNFLLQPCPLVPSQFSQSTR